MCFICNSDCCRRWFPEWARETSMTLFWIKFVIIAIIAGVVLTMKELDTNIFSDAKITYASMALVVAYCIVLAYLVVIYWPYQKNIAPMWIQSIIYVIWAVFTFAFFLNGWYFHWWSRSDNQPDALDYWTIGHTLSGIVLAFMVPWWWTFGLLVIWEVLERDWTVGLGDGESDLNHLVDIIVAVVGWWIVILACPRSRKDIPWISSRNSCGNEGKCCFNTNDGGSHVAQYSDNHSGQTYDTVHV